MSCCDEIQFGCSREASGGERRVHHGFDSCFRHNLVEIRPDAREAVCELVDSGEQVVIPYQMIHVTPPMSSPDVIKQSPLADEKGWVEADKYTLQHPRFPEVFAIGDAAGLPTSKTGAAVRKQAPVLALAENDV